MKNTELRIGNWALYENPHSDRIEFQITAEDLTNTSSYEPIPLTEEWSIKFGYECLVEMAFDFADESKLPIKISVFDLKNMAVHEAQNLYYALTNQELIIK